jgi:hypothetical protein
MPHTPLTAPGIGANVTAHPPTGDPPLPTSTRGPPPPAVPATRIRNIPTGSAQQQAVAEDIAINSFRASGSADRTIFVIRAFRLFGSDLDAALGEQARGCPRVAQ